MSLLKVIGIKPWKKSKKYGFNVEDLLCVEDGVKVAYIRLKDGYQVPCQVDRVIIKLLSLQVQLMNAPYNYSEYEKDFLAIEKLLQDYIEYRQEFVGESKIVQDKKMKIFEQGLSQIEIEIKSRLAEVYERYSKTGISMISNK